MSDMGDSASPHNGVASPGPGKKRKRKSRKGLEKRFTCSADGCGKVYSRAEHLQRHQLNHNSPQTFRCDYPDCNRTFVRPDLLKRHLDRHVAKSAQGNDQYQNVAPSPSQPTPHRGQSHSSPEAVMYQQSPGYPDSAHQQTDAHVMGSADVSNFGTMLSNARLAHGSNIPGSNHAPPHGISHLNSNQIDSGYEFAAAKYAHDTAIQPISHAAPAVPNQIPIMNHMSMGDAGPVFGTDSGLHKSPSGGMPEDFMVYLFDSTPDGSVGAGNGMLPPASINYGDLNHGQYPDNNSHMIINSAPVQQLGPQQIMSVYNLLEPNMKEASMSDQRSQELFDFIKNRFHGNESEDMIQVRESIISGDRNQNDHMLSKRMMQAYIGSFWRHFNGQIPILHKPTFVADKTPTVLLLAIMAIGAACLDKKRGTEVTDAGVRLSNFLVTHLRWEVFMDPGFRPPAKLWVFQALLYLELYEKMCSTRELHERAHIHHATTITLMRRGRSLIGKSSLDSPKGGSNGAGETTDEHWNQWIINESTRRTACAAFMIDSVHATMFGHSVVMAAHEMRLPLPCHESLWTATSSAELSRAESNLMAQGVKPISFLEGLKRTLNKQEIKTTYFGRGMIMAGLLNVTYHLNQRDLQANVLGGGMSPGAGARDKWRIALTRAYDFWQTDFDRTVRERGPLRDPYGNRDREAEISTMYESRTVLHHIAHMAMHADVVDCQIFARAQRLLGRPVGPIEFNAAQRRIKEDWAPSARARDAAFYALKFLQLVFAPDQIDQQDEIPFGPPQQQPYEVRNDILLNRPWVLYFAGLVLWCYGYATEGPSLRYAEPTTHQERWSQMRGYLSVYAGLGEPAELRDMKGVNGNLSLLLVLQASLRQSRWELLHEAATLLQNCITLSRGGAMVW